MSNPVECSAVYGHRLQQSLALAMIERDQTTVGTKLQVHVMGELRSATVIDMSPYDPGGTRMRQ